VIKSHFQVAKVGKHRGAREAGEFAACKSGEWLMTEYVHTSVFLLSQNRLLRDALSRLLSNKDGITIVGSSALTTESPLEIVSGAPNVLVIESFTTATAELECVREAQRNLPDLRLVVIGMETDEQRFLEAIREGAMGYIVKDASALEIVEAIRVVAIGGASCSPELCAFLFRCVAKQGRLPSFYARRRLGLTNREQQVVGFISHGLTNKEIAGELCLAEHTVRNHIHRMLRKLGANHRLAIVDICRTQGIAI